MDFYQFFWLTNWQILSILYELSAHCTIVLGYDSRVCIYMFKTNKMTGRPLGPKSSNVILGPITTAKGPSTSLRNSLT